MTQLSHSQTKPFRVYMWPKTRVAYSTMFRSVRIFAQGESVLGDLGTVIHLPWWFPGAGFKKDADMYKRKLNQCRDIPYEAVKKALVRIVLQLHTRAAVFS